MNNRDGFPGDMRKEQRTFLFTPVKFFVTEQIDEILNGIIVNLSDSGMEIFSYVPLPENQKITIISVPHILHKTFRVEWVRKYLDDFFIIGLKKDAQ